MSMVNEISEKKSAVSSGKSSINVFFIKLSDILIKLVSVVFTIVILLFFGFLMNLFNAYVDSLILQMCLKILCLILTLFIKVKLMTLIYEKILNTDVKKMVAIIMVIALVDVLCVLVAVNIIDENTFPFARIVICITVPWLLINIGLAINKESMIPFLIILLSFVVGIATFTLSFFIEFGLWKHPLILASIVYMLLGLLIVIYLIIYSISNRKTGIIDSFDKNNVTKDAIGDAKNGASDVKDDAHDAKNEVKSVGFLNKVM